ncbi:hypothetical protein PybrP1_004608, partial [[Pythium] brassicae (nom. inval.)]
EL